MQDKGCCTERDYCPSLDAQTFLVAENAVHYKCSGNALVVPYCVDYFVAITSFYIYITMAAVHARVGCLDRQVNHSAFVIAPNKVVALAQR